MEGFFRPLFPERRDQGDPYVMRAPDGEGTRFRFYVYVTGLDAPAGRAFPAYGSDDLARWVPLGGVLAADVTRDHWAPCVRFVPGLARPWVMLYSRGLGLEEQAHIGHALRRADAVSPEGPFADSGHVLTAGLDFAIDPDVYRLRDGRQYLAFATDFVHDPPLGTGIVEAPVTEDLTALLEPPRVLARAQYGWQVYDPARRLPWMEIPGVDWDTDTVVWHTVEAPVGGLVSPHGQDVYLYSGGCFFAYYAIGALVREAGAPGDQGERLVDVTRDGATAVLQPQPERGLYGPGHCSLLRGADAGDGIDRIVFHARFGAPDAPRQMALARLEWTKDGDGLLAGQPETGIGS
jgi:GH43 family beta-xylosidase